MKLNWLEIRNKFNFKSKIEAAEYFGIPYNTFITYTVGKVTTNQQNKVIDACLKKKMSLKNIFVE